MNGATQSAAVLPAEIESLIAELYTGSGAQKFGLQQAEFTAILLEVRAKYLAADASIPAVRELYVSLRVEDLALARACAAGNERAWEVFMARFREKLYDVAGYIAKESSAARELADSLYADLYGTTTRDGQRVCKLTSYTGRGSLEGWLRTVLAQEHVNRYRRQRRLVSLDEESEEGRQFAAPDPGPLATVDTRIESATDEVLAGLSADDRFVLAAYYLDQRTLAEIARVLGVHESTISRKLDKMAKSLRKQILAALGRRGMSRRQALEAMEVDVRDLRVNIRTRLAQERDASAFPERKAEAQAGEGSG
ncbi:MAG TPA: sigma-70 family RNA polymerase sigma factor [Terriglobales bacterium]|jgi:RNA polymerase sigma-70 factor (ECF subfamily)|nr:sigma-70 family RNA polymerase sigma factor [Terriglobales bacterium]